MFGGFAPQALKASSRAGLYLVIEIGCTIFADGIIKIVTTHRAIASLAMVKPTPEALRMKLVTTGTFHLSKTNGSTVFNSEVK